MQAYLRDCEHDLSQLAEWAQQRGTPVWVRLVKGAYWDYETIISRQFSWPCPVWAHKWETDANYEKMTRFLMENHAWLRPALASHNVRSLAHALALAKVLNLPPRAFEIQMLYGMAEPIKDTFVAMGQRVRVYTPYGELLPGMAYLVRRLLENTANESFLRASFTEHIPEEQLLMNPMHKMRNKSEPPTVRAKDIPLPNGRGSDFIEEPLADFSRAETRTAMQTALQQVAAQLGRTYPVVVNNRDVSPAATFDSINPSHKRQLVGKCARATVEQANQAIAAATAAFPAWARHGAGQNAPQYLFDAANILRRRRATKLAAWEVYECGKPWREADADVAETIDYCDFYAHEMIRLATPRPPRRGRRRQFLFLRTARRRRRDRTVELPARHPRRHDGRGPCDRQHGDHEAGGTVVRHRRQVDGGFS